MTTIQTYLLTSMRYKVAFDGNSTSVPTFVMKCAVYLYEPKHCLLFWRVEAESCRCCAFRYSDQIRLKILPLTLKPSPLTTTRACHRYDEKVALLFRSVFDNLVPQTMALTMISLGIPTWRYDIKTFGSSLLNYLTYLQSSCRSNILLLLVEFV